ncbi:hypothetical protein DF3PB_600017 [uncultured Defluviicoccus sp.]|uniref:Uncharacterized protein n=1 Tax=metagenome TaxID=256318 RepID=A0A380TKJ3_9ZZZZ|nr:hypothetical protein DF3PB_600017 [uncultured Defluviicoccus sp.]
MSAYDEVLEGLLLDKENAVNDAIAVAQASLNFFFKLSDEERLENVWVIKDCIPVLNAIVRRSEDDDQV